MNRSDSARLKTVLEELGFKETSMAKNAHLVIYNSCSVRQKAEDRVIGLIHDLKKNNTTNAKCKIGVTGCMARRTGINGKSTDKLFRKIKNLDFVFRIEDIYKLPAIVQNFFGAVKTIKTIKTYFKTPQTVYSSFSAFVPIMTGCNNFCSYCIVPYARGREKSRTIHEILCEIKNLAKRGIIEIILLGQNVNSYKCPATKKDFADLLKEVNKIKELKRIRYSASHPKDFSDKLIKVLPKLNKVCEHIHLPIQAGDSEILKQMNRKYTTDDYLELVKKIRKYNPNAVITTDIIVGFPGETKKQFENTKKFIEHAKFPFVFISQYSPRQGTAAYKMEDNVPKKEKSRRWHELNNLLAKLSLMENKKLEGKTVEVLVDSRKKNFLYGKTRTNREVRFPVRKNFIGKIIKVKCIKAKKWFIEGEKV